VLAAIATMSGATAVKGKNQANKNAYRRAKKKAQRSETPSEAADSARGQVHGLGQY